MHGQLCLARGFASALVVCRVLLAAAVLHFMAPGLAADGGELRGVPDCNEDGIPDEQQLDEWTQRASLTASDADWYDEFGSSVSISGDTVIVGAQSDDHSGLMSAGSAYVFVRVGGVWTEQAKLTASDAATADGFGASVSISGDTAIVGANQDDHAGGSNAGSAYIFVRTGGVWTEQAKLTASDAAATDYFGTRVSISSDTAIVGAYVADPDGLGEAGAAYVFVRTGGLWTQQAKLTASDAASDDHFGESVSIDGDYAIVGSRLDDHAGGSNSGSAYVFTRSGGVWAEQAKLTASDAASDDHFGESVSIFGDTAIVGAYRDDHAAGSNAGSAYVFVRTAGVWTEQTKLTASDAEAGDIFGYGVSISGDTAIVGALGYDSNGSAYVFVRSGGVWEQAAKLRVRTDLVDGFGHAVSVSGSTVIVASDDDGPYTSAAYIFNPGRDCDVDGIDDICQLEDNDCNGDLELDVCEPDCNGNAVPDVCDVAGATSLDCNADEVPDECQLYIPAQQAQMIASDSVDSDSFGFSVSISRDTAIVGASSDDHAGGVDAGSAYVFVRSGGVWTEQAKLIASDAVEQGHFGVSVSIHGDTAIVGVGVYPPAAYVFVRDGSVWTQQAKLTASDAPAADGFGISVSIFEDTAVVGAYLADHTEGTHESGAAYVYVRSDGVWTEQARLIASDAMGQDRFGRSVSISGDTAIVGAHHDRPAGGMWFGSAYVFERSGGVWTEQAKLTASDADDYDRFGVSASIHGDTAIVGGEANAAYIFVRNGGVWTEQARLTGSDATFGSGFGQNVSISGDTAIVGAAWTYDGGVVGAGAAYLFTREGGVWTEQAKLPPPWAAPGGLFGASVAIEFNTAIVGALLSERPEGLDVGSVYAFTPDNDCNANGILDECDIAAAVSGDCNGNGMPDECDLAGPYGDDCNANGTLDDCELIADPALDCNANDVPDECDLAAATSDDCNANDVPDECDIAGPFGDDCNANGILDDCELFADPALDCNANGILDECDIAGPSGDDCNANGVPDECDIATAMSDDCNANELPDECDIAGPSGDDCNANGILDECDIAAATSNDCNANDVPDECDIAAATSDDCNANDVPDECDIAAATSNDCNANGAPDECDIATATSDDCNANDVPDECEIAGPSGDDCNANGILDECDIAAATSNDCNANGAPDECDLAGATSDDCNADGVPDDCQLGTWTQRSHLMASDAAPFDDFGRAVALDGLTAIVGSYSDDHAGGADAGSAYVLVFADGVWTEQAKLTASDAAASDRFGFSVSIFGDTAIVGAYSDDHAGGVEAGSAYVFVRSGGFWTQQAKLTASDAAASDRFGISVAIHGDTAIVGANLDDHIGADAGSAYVFVRSGGAWTQQAKLTASDAAAGDLFGTEVSISGDSVLVGAYDDDHAGGSNAGSAYVFVRSGGVWSQQAKLTAADGEAGDNLGFSVSIDGNTAVAGAMRDNLVGGADAGSAYVFVRNGSVWAQQAKLTASDEATGAWFGYSVSVDGNALIVGANQYDGAGGLDEAGAVYMFTRSGAAWAQEGMLTAADAAAGDNFGVSVALAGTMAIVGANEDDHAGGSSAGSVYVVRIGRDCDANGTMDECEADCNGDGTSDACEIASDPSLDCNGNGTPDQCDIAEATSPDCNADSVPDECQLDIWTERVRLAASDAAASDEFGVSVSISGDTAIVGARSDDHAGGTDAGSAYVFVLANGAWTEQAKLTASDAAASDAFGFSVSISGDTAIVGAYLDDHTGGSNAGSAYVFVRSGGVWTEQAKLTASDSAASDFFGLSVSISGDTAIVGAWADDHAGGSNAGSAYVFVRSGGVWTQQAKLTASDAAGGDEFGAKVSISGDTAIVGATQDDHAGGTNAGSAYVFVRSSGVWTQQAKLIASDAVAGDEAGYSVSISGDSAIVGARFSDPGGRTSAGAAYVFVRSGGVWTQQAKLTASDGMMIDVFGYSVSIDADTAIVGAHQDDHAGGGNAGSAYIFVRSGGLWAEQAKLTASDAASNDQFGNSVALHRDTAIVGTSMDDHAGGSNAGSLYVFRIGRDCDGNDVPDECELEDGDCNGNGVPDSCDIDGETSEDQNANGVPDECEAGPGDLNGDNEVNVDDLPALLPCMGGPGVSEPGCDPEVQAAADLDGDDDVDLADFVAFQLLVGANQP